MNEHAAEVARLVNRHLDGVLSNEEDCRLRDLLKGDSELVDIYIRLSQIHGQLVWGASAEAESKATRPIPALERINAPSSTPRTISRTALGGLVAALGLLIAVGVVFWSRLPNESSIVERAPLSVLPGGSAMEPESFNYDDNVDELPPLTFDSLTGLKSSDNAGQQTPIVDRNNIPRNRFTPDLTDEEVIIAIDQGIATVLADNGLEPSRRASDEEWVRRAYLTVTGRIPTLKELAEYLDQPETNRRQDLIERLVAHADRDDHLAEVWASLLVGRSQRPYVNRGSLVGFLADAFEENLSWMVIVGDLISAAGRNDSNGATNFLLAHLDNQATPATAVTARLFLGEQLQCVQCHDHPFASGVQQREYWALNAFFQHTRRIAANDGRRSETEPARLVDRTDRGMTFYETLQGRQEAVLPEYDGQTIAADRTVARRSVLAEFLASDSRHRVARAMVNRMWSEFFGYGFTNPVDDMGTHVPVSHPELLDTLTEAFVASGYDLKRLQKWIALSEPWQRTSQATEANESDAPDAGGVPLFTRVYIRRMSPEQMYDSLRIAIRGAAGRDTSADSQSAHRRDWVSQFVHPYDTDENDEVTQFDGSIAQAMVMMNETDLNQAIRDASRSLLQDDDVGESADDVLERVAQLTLTRDPTPGESAVFRRRLKRLSRATTYRQAVPSVVEDMMWAYLNSSEFSVIH